MNENEFLSTEVMKWQIERDAKIPASCEALMDKNGMAVMLFSRWNPRENIEQAMMLLDKFKDYEPCMCYYEDHGWGVTIALNNAEAVNDSLTDAIVDAVLQAMGYEK